MKKLIALLLAAAMILAAFAGCSAKKEGTNDGTQQTADPDAVPGSTADTSEEDVVINFLGAMYSDKTEPYLREVVAAFEKENPHIKVNLEIVGWDNITTRAAALVGAGQAPDIYNANSAAEYVPDGLLYNIKDIVSPELLADFYPSFIENNRDATDGEAYAVPYLASVRALYCNEKIFEEVGIEAPPKTWDEVEDVCRRIYEFYDGDVYPWGIDASTTEGDTMIAYYGWSNGGGYVDDDYNWILDCPENIEGLEWALQLYRNGWTNPNPTIETRDDMQKLVAENKLAMLVTACFFPALYPDTGLMIGEIPYNDKNVSSSSTLGVQDGLMIFNGSAKGGEDTPAKKAAITKFLDFFFQPEYYTQFMINEGLLPATQSGAQRLAELEPDQSAYIDILGGARFEANNLVEWRDVMNALIANQQLMFEGSMTAQEALEASQQATPAH